MWSLHLHLGPAASQAFAFNPCQPCIRSRQFTLEPLTRWTPGQGDLLNLRVLGWKPNGLITILCCEVAWKWGKGSLSPWEQSWVVRLYVWGWKMLYWTGTQMWWGDLGPTMAFAGEAEGAPCGEWNPLRLQQQLQGVGCLVGRRGSTSPGCHRGRTLWNHNGAEWNRGVATIICRM